MEFGENPHIIKGLVTLAPILWLPILLVLLCIFCRAPPGNKSATQRARLARIQDAIRYYAETLEDIKNIESASLQVEKAKVAGQPNPKLREAFSEMKSRELEMAQDTLLQRLGIFQARDQPSTVVQSEREIVRAARNLRADLFKRELDVLEQSSRVAPESSLIVMNGSTGSLDSKRKRQDTSDDADKEAADEPSRSGRKARIGGH